MKAALYFYTVAVIAAPLMWGAMIYIDWQNHQLCQELSP